MTPRYALPNSLPQSRLPFVPAKQQEGAILLVALILLVVLSMLGFTALRTATMQERMTGTVRDRNIAFMAAESALRAAERYLSVTTTPSVATATGTTSITGCTRGVFPLVSGVPYFVAQGKTLASGVIWDGQNPDFWDSWPWDPANYNSCFFYTSSDYVDYVATADYGKPGRPIASPRYVIEALTSDGAGLNTYRVTALGWGSSKNARVILQATYRAN